MNKQVVSICLYLSKRLTNNVIYNLPAFFQQQRLFVHSNNSNRRNSIPQISRRPKISNRQKFKQIEPKLSTLIEIENHGLARRHYYKGKYGKKVFLMKKKKFEEFSKKTSTEEDIEGLELPRLSFFAGAQIPSSFPKEDVPELAFVGRSNVGKSSLINALGDTTTARTSDKPGLTQQINFYAAGNIFNLVDMPGYGFAYADEEARLNWKKLIETYISTRKSLKRLYVLLDARHGIKIADKEFLMMVEKSRTKFQLILTKCDLVLSKDIARRYQLIKEELKNYRYAIETPIMVSSRTRAGIDKLRRDLLFLVNGLERAREVLRWKRTNIQNELDRAKRAKRQLELQKSAIKVTTDQIKKALENSKERSKKIKDAKAKKLKMVKTRK
ncbi:848_t:CDS:2 [Ambispora leptoticha]|uniref:848_t:CDS:1 n=1 Tax=Ambispora leptoticha TaxID=144679 RepID=A0A9N8VJA6_9GLOM|nr:848_t:CDS:2 [Ambispora leptoticha]